MYLVLNSSTLIIVVLLAIACLYFIDCLSVLLVINTSIDLDHPLSTIPP